MKLLILGESDSVGMSLLDPRAAWGNRLPAIIEERLGEAVDCVHVRYYPWSASYREYLEKTLTGGPFDVVVSAATSVGYTVYSADNRIRRILGDRAGDWFKARVRTLDYKTLYRQPDGWKKKGNRRLHAVGQRLIGQAPGVEVGAVIDGYLWTLGRLARLEDTQVVFLVPVSVSKLLIDLHPELHAKSVQFQSALRVEAERRRFETIERDALRFELGDDPEAVFTDGVHKGLPFHNALAEAIAAKIIASRRSSSPAAELAT